MPTSEERLEALERALSRLQSERVSLDERIHLLQQQIADQRRLLAEREQAIGQVVNEKFDTLLHVVVEHANAVVGRFADLDADLHQHFTSIDSQLSQVARQGDQHTADMKGMRRDVSDALHNATIAVNVAQAQEGDIRLIKEQVGSIKEGITDLQIKVYHLDENVTSLNSKVDLQGQNTNSRFDTLNSKVDQQGTLLLQILDRLPPAS